MIEYIEREAAIEKNHGGVVYIDDIKNIPVAYVAPVRHGRWVTTSGEVFPGSSQFLCYSHKHEECGFQYIDMGENEYNFCPHCGARMDGK